MRFLPTPLAGAFIVDVEPHSDERGLFARTFCATEFAAQGLVSDVRQCSVSTNHRRGTIRGMHYQRRPAAEAKLVRCIAGAILDVIIDLRPDSPTYLQHVGVELTAANRRALFVPELFAHGFQTLADDSEVFYQISAGYEPTLSAGLRFDDPVLGIAWPLQVTVISEKDRCWPLLANRSSSPARPGELP